MRLDSNMRHMTDGELSAAIRNLIDTREPESIRLDYKEKLNLGKDSDRRELAKDVSSFANEQGGMVLYGVPEAREDDLPRPKPLTECGIELDTGLPGRVEDILLSTLQPPVHALTIRVVDIEEIRPRQLLLVYHPESYWKPHMVEGYSDRRYYRRGEFRAIKMTEREVEAAYLAREGSRRHAAEFFEAASFGPTYGIQLRAVACPIMPGRFKDTMLQPGFRDWLDTNRPMGPTDPRAGTWVPFLDGWRFLGHPEGSIAGKQYEIRLFHNGAVCLNLDLCASSQDGYVMPCIEEGFLLLDEIVRKLEHLFVEYSSALFQQLAINGPVVAQLSIFQARGLEAAYDIEDLYAVRERREQVAAGKHIRVDRQLLRSDPDSRSPYLDGDAVVFEEESSTDEMVEQPQIILTRLMKRISTTFGLWGTAEDAG